MTTGDQPLPVVALVKDLTFSSKITATARAAGRTVAIVRDPLKLAGQAGWLLLADLSVPGSIEAAAEWKRATGGAVVAFVSHVEAETIQKAREMGLDQVLARSAFAGQLESLLRSR